MLLVLVGDSKYLVRVITILACSVNLQFNAEIPLRIAVEYRLGLESVIVDRVVLIDFVVVAFTAIIIPVEVVSIVFVKQCIAARAACIVVFITALAERGVLICIRIISPNNLATSVAGCGVALITICAYYLAVNLLVFFIFADECSAV